MTNTDPVKVGVLYSQTGATSAIESSQRLGTLMAIEEINEAGGINGREIVAIQYDPASNLHQFRAHAERLVAIDNVNVIFGCYMSSTRKAVMPVVEKYNRILFYATLYEGFEFSNNIIYTGAAPNQNSVQLADYMMSSFGGRVYLVGSDYIYPYESNRIMSDLVNQRPGGSVVAQRYVPLDAGAREFDAIAAEIREMQPDFIFSTVVGNATQHLYRAYAEAGLNPKTLPIASLTTSEVEVAQMGAQGGRRPLHGGAVFLVDRHAGEPARHRPLPCALRRRRAPERLLGGGLFPGAHVRQRHARDRHRRGSAAHAAIAGHRIRRAAGAGPDRAGQPPHAPVPAHRSRQFQGRVLDRARVQAGGRSRPLSGHALAGRLDTGARGAAGLMVAKTRTLVRTGMRAVREAPQILRDLRSLRVCVFHPRDQDGEGLTRQLERIGCQVKAFWPPPPALPEEVDVVFMSLSPDMVDADFDWCQIEDGPPVIAVVTYENPTIIEAVLRVGAIATVASPVRSFGLLSVLVLARDVHSTLRKQKKRIAQLEAKLQGARQIAEAQDILVAQQGITKEEAYHLIREQAMQKRVTAEEIAKAIINANEILGFRKSLA